MKKTRLRKVSKDPRTVQQKKTDRALQDWFRSEYSHARCEVCKAPFQLMHHFVEKSQSTNLRYDHDNLIFLCHKCHAKHHQFGDTEIAGTIILQKGGEWFKNLHIKKRIDKRYTIKELREIEAKYKL